MTGRHLKMTMTGGRQKVCKVGVVRLFTEYAPCGKKCGGASEAGRCGLDDIVSQIWWRKRIRVEMNQRAIRSDKIWRFKVDI